MLKSGAVCIAYETVEKKDHSLPLLIPMSEVAGRMATQNGAYYLQKTGCSPYRHRYGSRCNHHGYLAAEVETVSCRYASGAYPLFIRA